jgi:hypothetical protein
VQKDHQKFQHSIEKKLYDQTQECDGEMSDCGHVRIIKKNLTIGLINFQY